MDGRRSDQETSIGRLLTHVGASVERALGMAEAGDGPVLEQLAVSLPGVAYTQPVRALSHPAVERWLDEALAVAPPEAGDFARTFAECASTLRWNTAYADLTPTPVLERFWSNYSYAAVVAPEDGSHQLSPCRSDHLALFLVVQGAGVAYDRHHHPATEVYGIVAGTGWWLRGDAGYRPRNPGEVFVHPANVEHATTTDTQPTISWVAWLGDLHTRPTMSSAASVC